MTMLEKMKSELASIEEAIGYEERNDRAYTKWYRRLLRKSRILTRYIRVLEKEEAQMQASCQKGT